MSDFKIKKYGEIVVALKGKPEPDGRRRRTDLLDKRELDYLPRRRRPSDVGINFYDLGVYYDLDYNEWFDIDFEVIPTFTFDGSTPVLRNWTLADWNELRDLIFEIDPSDWHTRYKKLGYEEAERYGLDIVSTSTSDIYSIARDGSRLNINGQLVANSKWTESGLVLETTPAEFKAQSYGAFVELTIGNILFGYRTKVTTEPDFGAAEVTDFRLARKADVFLVPDVMNIRGFSLDTTFFGTWRPYERAQWLDWNYTSVYGSPEYPMLSLAPAGSNSDVYSGRWPEILTYARQGSAFYFAGGGEQIDKSLFPISSGNGSLQFDTGLDGSGAIYHKYGQFLGAIYQNSTFYYVWNRYPDRDPSGSPYAPQAVRIIYLNQL